MERLTERYNDGQHKGILVKEAYGEDVLKTLYEKFGNRNDYFDCEEGYLAMEKLADYEDAEEQGLLLRLPVAIGQTVYTNYSMQGWYCRSSSRPYEAEVVYIGLNNCEESGGGYINISFKGKKGYMLSFTFKEIGITWFLTKEEAEQALKKMGE